MDKRCGILKNMSFGVAIMFAAMYLCLTALYQLVPLSGKVAMSLFSIGQFLAIPFGLSILLSVAMLFSWKRYKYFYIPFLISVLTFAFLYWAWFIARSPQTATNNYRGAFYRHTALELPSEMNNIRNFDGTNDSFLGDGNSELSFRIDTQNVRQWMADSNLNWKQGMYQKRGQILNEFTDNYSLIFKDGTAVKYTVIDRTPVDLKRSPEDISNSTTIFVNEAEGWVLIKDHDL